MKVKVGENVYLSKYEVAHIMHDLNSFPATIIGEVFGNGKSSFFFISGPTDAFRFESVFKNPASVKWLMGQDWIVDYDEYSEMPLPSLRLSSSASKRNTTPVSTSSSPRMRPVWLNCWTPWV